MNSMDIAVLVFSLTAGALALAYILWAKKHNH
jgi:general stress protein CsbA